MIQDLIKIKGAKTHNLKNIDVEIPKNKLIVVTGLSGSGKSSLAFDTIYAEGQRKYVESLSSYARQFLGLMEKPDVEFISGLSPAISIDQKSSGHNPRSTVGTITEIYDYLRLLFARIGHPRSPKTGNRLEKQTVQQIVDTILDVYKYSEDDEIKIMILSPVVKGRKGTYGELFTRFLAQGYVRARVNGEVFNLEEDINLDRYQKHYIEIVVDRLVINSKTKDTLDTIKRITDSVELSLNLGNGEIFLSIENNKIKSETNQILTDKGNGWSDLFFSENLVDQETGESFPEVEPHTFSFNSPHGACKNCSGLGNIREIDPSLLFNPNLSIAEGGIFPWMNIAEKEDSWTFQQIQSVADNEGFSLREPISNIAENKLNILIYGSGEKKYKFEYVRRRDGERNNYLREFEGIIPNLNRRYAETDSDYIRKEIEEYMIERTCPVCNGLRLQNHALAVTIGGLNIIDVAKLPIGETIKWVKSLTSTSKYKSLHHSTLTTHLNIQERQISDDLLNNQEKEIGNQIFKEIETRLNFLIAVGLDYLSLDRTANTLSGGESQRIRLASQIGTGLTGVLYILDEPSIGLHQRDNHRLLETLIHLRDLGNTVIVVEHDEDTIRNADYIIDIGPKAGEHGGEVVAIGDYETFIQSEKSITAKYLRGEKKITRENIDQIVSKLVHKSEQKKVETKTEIRLRGCTHNNLKDVDLKIPLGKFISITGVSGSGKSSLINETLSPIISKHLYNSKSPIGNYRSIDGIEYIDKAVRIDQSPIGRTPRSNPATYTGVFTKIREIFAETKEAKSRGYKGGRFSFNVKGGRCENCMGDGVIKIEMQFLPDVYIKCDVCHGRRYNRDTLQIDFKGKNIADVLEMTVEEGSRFFEHIPSISSKLTTLEDVGLGYIRLGQSATTLSGGEAQRVKLATELSKRATGKSIYILDEPTTGLHFEDVEKLLIVLHSLVKKGNTVIVIEHNLDVVKTSDWIIDMGPEGGNRGGEIIAEGTPDDIINEPKSYTGEWLRKLAN
jgi:excinuclease ABC subunit A